MSQHVYICINGILTWPGDANGWTDRAVTWLNTYFANQPVKAEKFEYACGALTRRLRQQWRAEAVAKMIGYYQRAGFRVTLVGHSNGCDLIARVLSLVEEPIASAHLFAPAADGQDFAEALHERHLQWLHLYGSCNDQALRIAGVSRTLFGWVGLGYGSLGRSGPAFAAMFPARVRDHSNDDFGHSDWWQRGEIFEGTMQLLIKNEAKSLP